MPVGEEYLPRPVMLADDVSVRGELVYRQRVDVVTRGELFHEYLVVRHVDEPAPVQVGPVVCFPQKHLLDADPRRGVVNDKLYVVRPQVKKAAVDGRERLRVVFAGNRLYDRGRCFYTVDVNFELINVTRLRHRHLILIPCPVIRHRAHDHAEIVSFFVNVLHVETVSYLRGRHVAVRIRLKFYVYHLAAEGAPGGIIPVSDIHGVYFNVTKR